MDFSLYDIDEKLQNTHKIDDFLENLSVNDFIKKIIKNHKTQDYEYGEIDPKPYIRTFESTLKQLNIIKSESQALIDESKENDYLFENKSCKKILNNIELFDNIIKDYFKLDNTMNNFIEKVSFFCESVHKIVTFREKIINTVFLIKAYHSFYTQNECVALETQFKNLSYDEKSKYIGILNNLLVLGKNIVSDKLPQTKKSYELIEQYAENVKNDYMMKFKLAFKENQFDTMNQISRLLIEFNHESDLITFFVNESNISILKKKFSSTELSVFKNDSILKDLSNQPFRDENFEFLLNFSIDFLKDEVTKITRIFNNCFSTLKIFLNEIFLQIKLKTSALLQYTLSVGPLPYVKALHFLYTRIAEFTKKLLNHFKEKKIDNEIELNLLLNQSHFDLFVDYISNESYFEKEKKHLEFLIYELIKVFNENCEKSLVNGLLVSKFESLDFSDMNFTSKTQLFSSTHFFSSFENKRLNSFKQFVKTTLSDRNSTKSTENGSNSKDTSNLNILKIEKIFNFVIDSISRLSDLVPNKISEYSYEIFEILIFGIVKLYVGSGFEIIYEKLKQENVNSKILSNQNCDLSYLESFDQIIKILFLISFCIKNFILPCCVNKIETKNKTISLSNKYFFQCDAFINMILNETYEMISNKLFFLLSKQKKKDFLCNTIEDDTEACQIISEVLTSMHSDFKKYLYGENLNNILTKIGLNFLNLLLEHYKKFFVNSTGGIVLTKDIIRFQSIIDSWNIKELSEKFLILREIGNLFTVQVNLINSLITENHLSTLKPYIINEYINKRVDFKKN